MQNDQLLILMLQWCSQDQNLKAKAEVSTLKAKALTFEAKVMAPEAKTFKRTVVP